MSVTHLCSLPFGTNPGRLDPCIGRHWIALPLTKNTVGLWKISQITKCLPIELTNHSSEVCAITLSSDRITYLVSACREKIFMWDLCSERDGQISSKLCHSNPGDVTALSINNSNDIIAVGVDFKILLLKEGSKDAVTILEAHRGMITKLAFCPHYSATLVSLSDDRSFCVWDIQDSSLLFHSKIISSSPLISVSMNWTNPQIAIGTADGFLKVFDLGSSNDFRQLSSVDISSALKKYIEKKSPSESMLPEGSAVNTKMNRQQKNTDRNCAGNPAVVQISESVLSVEYVYFAQDCLLVNTGNDNSSGISDILLEKPPLICVITSNAILQINSRSFEILKAIKLHSPIVSHSFCGIKNIGTLSYAASCQTNSTEMLVVVGTIFQGKIEVLQLEVADQIDYVHLDKTEDSLPISVAGESTLTIIPLSAVLSSSPLVAEMLPPIESKPVTKGDVATGKKKLSSVMNQPLTFKAKVSSSGYLQAPRTAMFKPDTSQSKFLNMDHQRRTKQEPRRSSFAKVLKADYDTQKGPPIDCCDNFQVDAGGSAVLCLRFSNDGSNLGCALSNKCALTLKSAYSKHISTTFLGHNNIVNSIYWSSSTSYVLTASNDKTALLWNKTGGEPLLSLTHQRGTVKEVNSNNTSSPLMRKLSTQQSYRKYQSSELSTSRRQSLTSTDNKPFTKEIKHAQFFYVDKFILLTHGANLSLFKYHIAQNKDDIKKYQCYSRYKLVENWQTVSAVFTATAAVNAFYSHLVICATSGRNVEVYDLNKSVLAHTFIECHSRPAHSIAINEGSCFASQPTEAHNVIATSSLTDPIKLWDLRTRTNVQALQGHLNNAHACQITFSPCGDYLASGSENQMVYIFDLRTGTYLDPLRGHSDVVTSVAFHPGYPLLASGSLNGRILFFKSL
ncbi:unnamed protein product [Candidula unifasciata]|uniref:WD repeat-containing protein 27 n=1 Tax=Candidula unifasciata TaxID=100452 RepID=A0A8S3ZI55_9EUPU|nr:unnamed protein product [Candidula unifasciata]